MCAWPIFPLNAYLSLFLVFSSCFVFLAFFVLFGFALLILRKRDLKQVRKAKCGDTVPEYYTQMTGYNELLVAFEAKFVRNGELVSWKGVHFAVGGPERPEPPMPELKGYPGWGRTHKRKLFHESLQIYSKTWGEWVSDNSKS